MSPFSSNDRNPSNHKYGWMPAKKIAGLAVGAILLGVAASYLPGFLQYNPWTRFENRPANELSPGTAIHLTDVAVKQFDGSRLVASAQVDDVQVRRDRQFFDLKGVRGAKIDSERGPVTIDAKAGVWNAAGRTLTVEQGARAKSKEFDLQAENLTFEQRGSKLSVPGPVQGRLLDGNVQTGRLTFQTDSRRLRVEDIRWEGNLALEGQDTPNAEARRWEIEGESAEGQGDVLVYTKGIGTDGDIIVRAERIEHNRKTDVVTATGKVEYYSAAANLVADKAVIYRREKRAVLSGNVTMLVKPDREGEEDEKPKIEEIQPFQPMVPDEVKAGRPEPQETEEQKRLAEELRSGANIREFPMVILAQEIEYWYRKGERRARISGSPQARQELPADRWRHAWATTAMWDGENDWLELFSTNDKVDVRMKNSMGDDLVAKTFRLSTKENDETFSGKQIKGVVFSVDDEIPRVERGQGAGANGGGGN